MLEQMALNDTVVDAAREVFETMIFMDLEACSDAGAAITGTALLGSITFKGSIEGCLTVCVSRQCAERIAKNMLGMAPEQEMSIEEASDAIGEVANMVMGSIKTRLLNTYPVIEVSIPSVIMGQTLKNSLGESAVKTRIYARLNEEDTAEITLLYREGNR